MLNWLSYMVTASLRAAFLEAPDVIIATSPQLFCGWAGVLTRLVKRRPLIVEMRDLWAESILTLTSLEPGRLYRLLERIEVRLYSSADRLVTVGDCYRDELVKRGVDPRIIRIFTNGVDRELFAPREPDEELKRSLGLEGRFVCSYVGTIGRACGLEVVIRAARKLKQRGDDEIVFLLVGAGELRPELERQARDEGLDNVVFLGRQPKQAVPPLLALSGCCLVHNIKAPLYATMLPSKLFEDAYMKRPIVLGFEGAAARVLEESGSGIAIEPGNADELIAAVERLAADPELCRRLGESGHRYVARHYDRDEISRRYLTLIEKLAAAAGG